MKATLLAVVVLPTLFAGSARAEEAFGAVVSAPMPRGGESMYAAAGFPSVRAGFREGFKQFEVGGEASFDWTAATFTAAATGRTTILKSGDLGLSLDARLGGFADAGAHWMDAENRSGAGLLVEVGTSLWYRTSWPVSLLAFAKVPVQIPLTNGGEVRVVPMLGGGAEVALSRDYFMSLCGAFGPDIRTNVKQTTRLSVEATLGFGWRVF
jgi:hypothetical protein